MIRVEKGTVRMQGHPAMLETELIATIKGFYNALVNKYGEEFAERRIDCILEKALESDEDEEDQDDEAPVNFKDILEGIREILKEMEGEM